MSDIKYCTKNSNEFVYKTPIKSAQKPSVCPDLSNRDLMYKDAVKSATIPNVVFYFRTNEDYKELSGRDARELKRIADDPNDYRVKAFSCREINGKNLTQIFENL